MPEAKPEPRPESPKPESRSQKPAVRRRTLDHLTGVASSLFPPHGPETKKTATGAPGGYGDVLQYPGCAYASRK